MTCFIGAGYLFGNIPVIKNNFTLVIMAVIAVSLIPIVLETTRQFLKARKT